MTERRDIASRLENWGRMYQQQRDTGAPPDRRVFDQVDAQQLDEAMPGLPTLQRSLLWWCYVRQETPDQVGRRLGISTRPALHFVDAFRSAQGAVELQLNNNQRTTG